MAELAKLRKVLDSFPWLATLLLVIFADFAYGAIYRFVRGDMLGIVFGIIWLLTGGLFGIGWIVDIVTVVLHKRITVLA